MNSSAQFVLTFYPGSQGYSQAEASGCNQLVTILGLSTAVRPIGNEESRSRVAECRMKGRLDCSREQS
jgi:hypothetical protein